MLEKGVDPAPILREHQEFCPSFFSDFSLVSDPGFVNLHPHVLCLYFPIPSFPFFRLPFRASFFVVLPLTLHHSVFPSFNPFFLTPFVHLSFLPFFPSFFCVSHLIPHLLRLSVTTLYLESSCPPPLHPSFHLLSASSLTSSVTSSLIGLQLLGAML